MAPPDVRTGIERGLVAAVVRNPPDVDERMAAVRRLPALLCRAATASGLAVTNGTNDVRAPTGECNRTHFLA